MKKTNIIKLSLVTILSLQVGVLADTNTLNSIDVLSSTESAYGATNGLVATKSATGSKMDVDIVEIPQSVSVVTKEAISNMNAQNITNVIAYTSAVTNSAGENGDNRTNYGSIRGIGLLYNSSFLNGLKLLSGKFLIPKIDPYSLEKVEVLKGPSSFLYGASTPGGLLNLQSKKPSENSSNEIGISYSSLQNKTIFADLNNKINDKLLFRVTGKYKEGDNSSERATNESYFINPSLTYLIDDTSEINLELSSSKNEIKGLGMSFAGTKSIFNLPTYLSDAFSYLNPTLITQLESINSSISSETNIGLPDQELLEKELQSIALSYNNQINDNFKFNTSMRYTQMDGDINTSQLDANKISSLVTTDLTTVYFSYAERSASSNTFAMDNNIEYKWGNANIKNTSLFGLDYQYNDFRTKKSDFASYSFDLINPDYSQKVDALSTYSENYNTVSKQLGLYVQNHMKIYDKFVISSSLRYDNLKETLEDKTADNDDISQTNDNISGRLGLVYLFDNGISPYVTYSTSFQGNVGSDSDGNKFVPSIGKQIEVGVKFKPNDLNALFSIAAFKLDQKDNVVTDPSDSSEKVQESDARVTGVEFDATVNPIENMNLSLSFAKMNGKEINTANPDYEGRVLSGLPDFSSTLWMDYTFNKTSIGDVKFGAGIKHVGKSEYRDKDYVGALNDLLAGSFTGIDEKTFEVEAHTTVDALVSTKYKGVSIALNIYNILDDQAKVKNSQVNSYETEGRTYSLTLKYKF